MRLHSVSTHRFRPAARCMPAAARRRKQVDKNWRNAQPTHGQWKVETPQHSAYPRLPAVRRDRLRWRAVVGRSLGQPARGDRPPACGRSTETRPPVDDHLRRRVRIHHFGNGDGCGRIGAAQGLVVIRRGFQVGQRGDAPQRRTGPNGVRGRPVSGLITWSRRDVIIRPILRATLPPASRTAPLPARRR